MHVCCLIATATKQELFASNVIEWKESVASMEVLDGRPHVVKVLHKSETEMATSGSFDYFYRFMCVSISFNPCLYACSAF